MKKYRCLLLQKIPGRPTPPTFQDVPQGLWVYCDYAEINRLEGHQYQNGAIFMLDPNNMIRVDNGDHARNYILGPSRTSCSWHGLAYGLLVL